MCWLNPLFEARTKYLNPMNDLNPRAYVVLIVDTVVLNMRVESTVGPTVG